MSSERTHEVTQLLLAMMQGEPAALDRLMPLVKQELSVIARRLLEHESPHLPAEPASIVQATYLRLCDSGFDTAVANRRSFFRVAARTMRQILVERAHSRAKESIASATSEPFDPLLHYYEKQGIDFLRLHEEIDRIGQANPRWNHVMTMRLFGGLTTEEIAAELNVPEQTVHDDWKFTMAVLHQRLQ